MAFSSTIQPVSKPTTPTSQNDLPDGLLSMVLLSVVAANGSKKALKQLKFKLLWTGFKQKIKSLFSKKDTLSTRTIVYILIGVVLLALLFIDPL